MKSLFQHNENANQAPASTCMHGATGRYFLLPLLLLLLSVGSLSAQSNVVIDKVSGPVSPAAGTTITVSHQTGTQSDRLMLVGISTRKRLVTGVTYGGTPLTLLTSQTSNQEARTYIYYMLNPPSGTANVIVTINAAAKSDERAVVGVMTFSNVDVPNFVANASPAVAVGNNTTPSVNVTSATGRLVFDVVAARAQNISVFGAGQTQRWLLNGQIPRGAAGTEPGAATTTMSYTLAGSTNWSISAVSIKDLNPAADLSITQTVSNPTPNIGSNVTFTLTATNNGPAVAPSVVVNNILPNGFSLVSATPSLGTWTAPNWSIPSLGIGSSATLTVIATVLCGNNFSNTATISSSIPDPNGANNSSTLLVSPQDNVNTNIFLCFGQTVNLTQAPYVPCNVPGGLSVTWHTGAIATSVNKVANPASIGGAPGVYNYYASFEDLVNTCYSPTTQFTVTIYPQLTISETINPILCFGGTGNISVVPSGGSGSGYTYAWSDGPSTSPNRTGLSAGMYTVTVTDGNNCTGVKTYDLTQPAQLNAVGLTTNVNCNGGNNGSIIQTVTGGTGLITYNWGLGQPTTKDRTNLPAGNYTVIITDANGCQIIRSYTITQPAVLSATASVMQPTCGTQGMINLTVTGGTTPYTFNWGDLPGTNNPQNRGGLSFGTYSVTITDAKGCTFSNSWILNDPMCPPGVPVCRDNIADAYSVDPDPFVTSYNWTVPPGALIVSGQGTSAIVVDWSAAVLGPGQICVSTFNTCGESAQFCYNVIVNQATASAFASPVCEGDDLQLSATGGTQYLWSGPGGFTSNLQNPFIFDATGANSGTYSVTVTDENGCSATASVMVTITAGPVLSSIPTPSTCGQANGSIDLTVTGGLAPYTYLWSTGATTQDIMTVLGAANYTVTVTDANGCASVLTTSVKDLAGPDVATIPTNVSCFGGSNGAVDISITGGMAPYLFNWSNGATTEDISGLSAGFYGVTVIDNNGCIGVSFANLTQPNPLQVNIATTNIECNGGSNGAIDLTVTGGTPGYTYIWSGTGVTPGAQDQTGLTAGIYNVTVTDMNGCFQTFSITLTQPAAINLTTDVNDVLCFGGATGTINLTVSGGTGPYTYNWGDLTPPPVEPQDRTGLTAGTYFVTVTDAKGCTASTSAMVDQPAQLSLTALPNDALCFGSSTGSIDLTVMGGTGPFVYAWSNGATTEDVASLAAATYSVTVTDANGCQATTAAMVDQPTALALSSLNTNISCFGGSNGAINLSVMGGTPGYTYSWSGAGVVPGDEDQINLTAGMYSVTVQDANNCTATLQVNLTSPTQIQASAFVDPASCFGGADGAITLTVNGGVGGYTYTWSNGLPAQQNQTGLAADAYTVTITDGNSCEFIDTYTVGQPTQLTVIGMATDVTCNGAGNGSVDITASGGVGPYTYAWSNGAGTEDISSLGPGSYTVTVTDFNLCTATNTFTVNQPAVLQVSGVTVTNCPSQNNGSITLTVTGGNAPYTFNWADLPGTNDPQNRTGLPSGLFFVTVTDSKGCTATANFTFLELTLTLQAFDRSCPTQDGSAFAIPANGTPPYTYQWNTGATTQSINGLDIGTYTVAVTDANGCVRTGNVTVGSPSCLPPVAMDDFFAILLDTPLSGSVATNDSDPDHPNSQLTWIPLTFIDPITEGIIEFDEDFLGGFTFTPVMGFIGTVSIQYQVCDPTDLCDVATLTIVVSGEPEWTLTKVSTAMPNTYASPGDVLTYDLILENIGNVEIGSIVVSDPQATSGPTYQSGDVNMDNILQPGETWIYTASYIVTQANIDAGSFTNTATANGVPQAGTLDPVSDSETVNATQTPDIALIKSSSLNLGMNGIADPGDIITYTYTVTNTGNVTLTGVTVTESSFSGAGPVPVPVFAGATMGSPAGTLKPGESATYTANYTLVLADMFTGQINNRGLASGTPPVGPPVTDLSDSNNPGDPNETGDQGSFDEDDPTGTIVPAADLAVTKTVDIPNPNVGQDVMFTITVTNNGPSAVTGVAVTDLLPAGLTYVSHTASQGIYTPGTGDWSTLSLANAGTATLTITATVTAAAVPNAVNTASVTASNLFDPVPGNNSASATVSPQRADLAVLKTVNNPAPNVGQNVTFTITVTNNGPNAATGVALNDLLPAGLTYVSHTASQGIYTPGTGDWSTLSLANAGAATLTITATVTAAALPDVINTAAITASDQFDPVPGNNSSSVTVTPQQADLEMFKSVSNPTPNVGQNVVFNITVVNNGPSAATGVTINDLLPAGLTYVSHTVSQGIYNPGTGNWGILSLANAGSATMAITATVTVAALPSVVNTATITAANQYDPNPDNNSASATVTPRQADLAVTKTVSNATPNVGQNIIFTITVENLGPDNATGITVNDLLPAGLTYVSHTVSQGLYIPGTGNWFTLAIANGGTAALTITATVTVAALPSVVNTAVITAADQYDPVLVNNSSSVTVTPQRADLAVLKTVNNPAANVGEDVTFTITVTNNGPNAATGVALSDLLPAGLTYVSHTASQGIYTPGTGNWSTLAIPFPGNATLTITATVTAASLPSVVNTAAITAADQYDPTPGNNSSSVTVTPQRADLAVLKTVNNPAPNVGQNVTFTITVTNNGPNAATGVALSDLLPAGLTYVSHTASQGIYTPGTGDWSTLSLANGGTATLTITATVTAAAIPSVVNTAAITAADQFDPFPGDNSSSVTVTPQQADLEVFKSVNNATPIVGQNVVFNITVVNNGPSAATGVTINDLLPAGLTYVSHTVSQGIYTPGTGNWGILSLANGGSATMAITATVTASAWPSVTNTVTVTGANQFDPDPDNNSASATVTPQHADLAVTKTVNNPAPNVGQNVTFTILVENLGDNTATGVSLNDLLPAGLTYVSHTTTQGTYVPASGVWSTLTLANAGTATLTITATVTVAALPSVVNTAIITGSNQYDPVPGNNMSSVTVTPQQANLSLAKTANNIAPQIGEVVTFTITVQNTGPNTATGVNVQDVLPNGFGSIANISSGGVYNGMLGTITWSNLTVLVGSPVTLTFEATVLATGMGISHTNYAQIAAADQYDPNSTPGNNSTNEDDDDTLQIFPLQAVDDLYVTPVNTPVNNNVSLNDTYPAGSTFADLTAPANGTLVFNPNGTFTYTPNMGFAGVDQFDYEVCFTVGMTQYCDQATVTIVVGPQANDDLYATPINTPVINDVSTNDAYPAGSTFADLTAPANGSLMFNPDGTFTYTPDMGFAGVDQFDYEVCFTVGMANYCDPATVTIVVGPQANDDLYTTAVNTPLSDDVSGNDAYPAGSTFADLTAPANGTLVFNPDGTFTYTPDMGFAGVDQFDYEVCFTVGMANYCDPATVTIVVGPQANDDLYATAVNTPLSDDVSGNDAYPAGSTFADLTAPANGTLVFNPDGTFTYTPDMGFAGVDQFDYEVCFTVGMANYCDPATVTIVVGPQANDDLYTTAVNTPLSDDVSGNDAYPAGSTFADLTAPANGTLVFNPDGTFTYTPDMGFAGVDQFDYEVCFTVGMANYCDPATVTIVVGPQANDDLYTTAVNTPLSDDVSGNDAYPAGSTFADLTAPANGTLVFNPDGTFTYTPDMGFAGVDQFDYEVCFTVGMANYCDPATVTIVVGPQANDDLYATAVNTPLSDDVSGNDAYPAGSTFADLTAPANGTLVFNPDGTFTYTPDMGFAGVDQFDYEVCFTVGMANYCDPATVTIVVGPQANDDLYTTAVNTPLSDDVSGNDAYPAGSTFADLTAPANGTLVFNPDGTFTYTPDMGFAGVDQFDYEVCFTVGMANYCDPATVTIVVGPQANDDLFPTAVNTPLSDDVSGNDAYPAGSTFADLTAPANGTLVFNPDGTFTYTPDMGFAGVDQFDYEVCFTVGMANYCDPATVTIVVGPQANDDLYTTAVNTPLSDDVSGNDAYPAGSTFADLTAPANGTLVFNPDGTFTYTPDMGFAGVDQFDYEVCFTVGMANYCDPATVTIVVGPQANDDLYATAVNTPLSDDVSGNDAYPAGSTFADLTAPANGTLVFNPDGTFTYTPDMGFAGVDQFDYEVCFTVGMANYCDPATVTIVVGPQANDDLYATAVNTPLSDDVSGNDAYPAGSTFADLTAPANGTLVFNPDGTFTYTPDMGFAGVDQFDYEVCFTVGMANYCDPATVTIVVGPQANDDLYATAVNTPLSDDVSGNDAYPAGSTFADLTAPANGTLVFNPDGTFTYTPDMGFAGVDQFDYEVCFTVGMANYCDPATVTIVVGPQANDDLYATAVNTPLSDDVSGNDAYPAGSTFADLTAPANGTLVFNPDGTFTYTPDMGFAGVDQFDYEVCFTVGMANYCDPATVTIVVGPQANDDLYATAVNTPLSDDVSGNDAYPAGSTFADLTAPANGTLVFNPDGTFTYTPDMGFAGVDQFDYEVCFTVGMANYCDPATVTIVVGPQANDDLYATAVNTPLSDDVSGNDAYPAGSTFADLTAPANGTLVFNPDGTFTYTPDMGFAGVDQFDYEVCFTVGMANYCDPATVTIVVGPQANDDLFPTAVNTPLSDDVSGNDAYPAGSTFADLTAPANGTLVFNPDGTFTYTPDMGFAGVDQFDYEVCFTVGMANYCDPATVTIVVGPQANDDLYTTAVNTPLSDDVSGNDAYPAGSTFADLTAPANGTLVFNPDGTFTYTPDMGFAGVDQFDYEVCFTVGMANYCDPATVTIVVGPQANDDLYTTAVNTPLSDDVSGNDAYPAGSTFADLTAPANGTLVFNPDGTFTYTPDMGFAGVDQFDYEVCFTVGMAIYCDPATVTIVVGPQANDDLYTTAVNTPLSDDVSGNDAYPAGSTFADLTAPANGTLVFNPDGTFTYTPDMGFAGVDQFDYEVCFTVGMANYCDPATVTIVVGPQANDDLYATAVNTPLSDDVSGNDAYPAGSTFADLTAPANGTLVFNPDGTFTYTPDMGFAGVDQFDYEVCFTVGMANYCDPATVTIVVGPQANDDLYTTAVNTPLSDDVSGNDAYPAGSTFADLTAPANGTLVFNPDGTFTYTPDMGFAGVDQFDYEVCFTVGMANYCDPATVTIVVGPQANDDLYTTAVNTPLSDDVSGNDAYPAGSTFADLTAPANGTLVFNPDGTFTYTPDMGFAGVDQFDYEVCFTVGMANYCDPATVTIVVGPQANDDLFPTAVNTPLSDDVSGNDAYPAGSTFADLTAPANGTLVFNPDGTFTYTPDMGFAGVDQFDYEVCFTVGMANYCDPATVTIVVGPQANDDLYTTAVNTPLSDDVSGNDAYPAGSTFADLTAPANGTLVFNPDGTFTYTPDMGFAGVDQFDYEVCFTVGMANYCDPATVTIVVGPQANDDLFPTAVNTPLSDDVSGNDAYPAGSTFADLTAPANGTLVFNPDGTFTYTPDMGFAGVDQFDYEVCFTVGMANYCDPATVTIVVGPQANDDLYTTAVNTPLSDDVSGNDAYPAGSTFADLTAPANGTLVFNPDGTFTYTPDMGFAGVDQFDYEVCFTVGMANYCDPATVTIVVGPQANDDLFPTAVNTPLSDDVSGNDAYPAGSTFADLTAPANGTLVFNPDGTFTYTPDMGFAGVDQFDYEVCFTVGMANYCDPATVTIVVGPQANDDLYTTAVNTPLSDDVSGNDAYPAGSTFADLTAPANGTLVFNPDGTFTYTPDMGFAGVDQFDYEVCFTVGMANYCDPATVTIVVGPQANDDLFPTAVNTPLSDDVSGNDAYPAGSTFADLTAPANGTLVFNPDGTFTYTPDMGFAGVDQFDYEVCFTVGMANYCDPATVTIVVGPQANDDLYTTAVNTPLSDDVSGNDAYPAGSTFADLTAPANGTLVFNPDGTFTYTPDMGFAGVDQFDYEVCFTVGMANYCDPATVTIVVGPQANDDLYTTAVNTPLSDDVSGNDAYPAGSTFADLTAPANGTLVFNPDGTFTYTPDMGFAGVDQFDYEVCFTVGMANYCDPATVTIVVGPQANDDLYTTAVNTPLSDDVSGNDAYPAGSTFADLTAPANGTLVFNPDGTFTYTPDMGFAGVDQFDYEVCFTVGMANYCDPATVTIVVGPQANDDLFPTAVNTPLSDDVSGNDAYPAGSTFADLTAPANGTLVFNPDGTFTYTPDMGFAGVDQFDYEVCFTVGMANYCDPATVTIVVGPQANDDLYATAVNTPLSDDVSGNDAYPAGSTFADLTAPANGTLVFNPDGTFTYTPDMGFAGVDQFDYEVCFTVGMANYCDPATVTIVVGPDAVDDFATTTPETPVSGDVSQNDIYPAGSVFAPVDGPDNGTLAFNPDGTFTYTPDPGFAGVDEFTYSVCFEYDGDDYCDIATVTIVVGPDAVDDFATTTPETPVSGDVSQNDIYPAGSVFAPVDGPDNGTLAFNPDGTFTYTPDPGFAGVDEFTYSVCFEYDGDDYCDIATVTIVVGPDAVDDFATTTPETPVSGDVSQNDIYPAGSVFAPVDGPDNGTLAFNPDGTFTYTPDPGFAGVDEFTYSVCFEYDGDDYCDVATVTIVVGPDAVDDFATTTPETPVSGDVSQNDIYPAGSVFAPVDGPDNGTLAFNPDGTFTYTPDPGFAGVDEFTYSVCFEYDGDDYCDIATVTIVVGPDAVDDFATTTPETPVSGDVSQNDIYPAGSVFAPVDGPDNGTLAFNPDGTFTYTPDPGFAGVDEFTYSVCFEYDGDDYCDVATVTIVVGPDAVDDFATTTPETPVSGDVSQNDIYPAGSVFAPVDGPDNGTLAFNPDGTFTYTPDPGFAGVDEFTYSVCFEYDGDDYCDVATVTIVVGPDAVDDFATTTPETPVSGDVSQNDIYPAGSVFAPVDGPDNGTLAFNPDGTFTYTPDPGFAGVDEFTYSVCFEYDGDDYCDIATVTIVVGPDAVDDFATTTPETPVSGDVSQNDIYPAGSVFAPVDGPDNGTLAFNPDGTFTYTPDPGFAGVDEFTYSVCFEYDGDDYCDIATVTIVVGPDAVDDFATTTPETPVSGDVSQNDIYPAGSVFAPVDGPDNGTLAFNPDGTFTYTPDPGFVGTDMFTYSVCFEVDNVAYCDEATVVIEVESVNLPPVAEDDFATTPENTPVVICVLENDFDPDGPNAGPLTIAYNGAAAAGNQAFNQLLGMVFTVNSSIEVTELGAFDDGQDGLNLPIQVGIVRNSDGMIMAGPITMSGAMDPLEANHRMRSITPVVLAPGEYTIVALGYGAGEQNGNSNIGGFPGTTTNTGGGLITFNSASFGGATFGLPTSPFATDNVFHAGTFKFRDATLTGGLSGSNITILDGPSNGTITIDTETGCITYTPDPGFVGTDVFQYQICDDGVPVLCDEALVYIEVTSTCIAIEAWVYLEGSAIDPGGLTNYTVPMRTSLNNLRVLPGQTLVDPFFGNKYTPAGQPYSIAPWNYFGLEGLGFDSDGDPMFADADYPATVVDWVLVSLRDNPNGTGGPVCQAAALLHNDGRIEFIDEFGCCDVNLLEQYYLVIEHRNHLIVMSHEPISLVGNKITYDFRTQQSYINDPFGFGIFAGQKEILPGVFAMYAGNGNQTLTTQSDTDINFDDRTFWESQNGNIGEYRIGDYNMNGDTNFNDRVTWELNNGKFTSVPRD
jgi:large repetitive protein